MTTDVIRLESPIDVMLLLHTALRSEASALEQSIREFDADDDSLQHIRQDFIRWAAALMFHTEQEDIYMTPALTGFTPAKDAEKEHAAINDRLEDVMMVLEDEIGKMKLIARTQRHLYGAVVQLRIAQDDHLESEEAFILPEIRERFDNVQQLDIIRRLLVDDVAEEKGWVLNWLSERLGPQEKLALSEFQQSLEKSLLSPVA